MSYQLCSLIMLWQQLLIKFTELNSHCTFLKRRNLLQKSPLNFPSELIKTEFSLNLPFGTNPCRTRSSDSMTKIVCKRKTEGRSVIQALKNYKLSSKLYSFKLGRVVMEGEKGFITALFQFTCMRKLKPSTLLGA